MMNIFLIVNSVKCRRLELSSAPASSTTYLPGKCKKLTTVDILLSFIVALTPKSVVKKTKKKTTYKKRMIIIKTNYYWKIIIYT